jgi:dihydroxyacetone kinase-like protein
MKKLDAKDIKAIFKKIKNIMVENEDYLFTLDSKMGDGDLGLTMKNGFLKVDSELGSFEEEDIGKILIKAGMTLASSVPSTMGTLMATGLMRAGKELKDKKTAGLDELANAFNAFVNGIAERGKAKPGEKTIIDSMLPAAETLIKASEKEDNIPDAFSSAYKAAEEGLEKTKSMKSVHGKAFYHSERSKGTIDPGAAAGVLFLKGFAEYINQR